MREYIDGKDVANTVMMLATAFKGTIAIVEGVTDRRLYSKFFDNDRVETVIAHSKANVRNSVRTLYNDRKFGSVIGIMDADLDYLNGRPRSAPLFLTDTRDSEAMMLKSQSFYDILHEYADEDRLAAFEDKYGDVRQAILEGAYPVGLLMYVSDKSALGLSFKDLDFETFIDRKSLKCDWRKMVDEVLRRSHSPRHVSPKAIIQLMASEPEHDVWEVCRGHDLMDVMAIGLKYSFGGNNSRNMTDSQLSGGFRLAYDRDDLESTELYENTSDWCKRKKLSLWASRA